MTPEEIAKHKAALAKITAFVQGEASKLVFRENFDAIGHFRVDSGTVDEVFDEMEESPDAELSEDSLEALRNGLIGVVTIALQQLVFLDITHPDDAT